MKDYKDYMDNLSVDETLHEKIMYRLTQNFTRQQIRTNSLRKYISVAACAAVMLFFIIGVYPYMNIWNTTPNGSNLNIPNVAGDPNLLQDKSDNIEQNSAVYHDVDASQLIRQPLSVKVPKGFWFHQRLMMMAKNETGIINNNGVRWEEQKFTKNDVETALQISIKDPFLPGGNYTVKQSVLINEATEQIIAYRTIYYFFDKSTMEFQNSHSVFYFAEQHFKADELEILKNISRIDGELKISDFPEPVNVHVKMPHMRKLVYVENGISIVVEAEADVVQEDGVVDKKKALRDISRQISSLLT